MTICFDPQNQSSTVQMNGNIISTFGLKVFLSVVLGSVPKHAVHLAIQTVYTVA